MIISTSGFGNTGASAVLDFLRGYDNIQVLDGIEFQLIHMPDGLLDLKYGLVRSKDRLSSNAAIKRFLQLKNSVVAKRLRTKGCDYSKLVDDFIEDINPIIWDGNSTYDPNDTIRKKTNILTRSFYHLARKRNPNLHPSFEKRYFSMIDEKAFDEKAERFIKRILESLNVDFKKDIVLDMLVSAVDPSAGKEFVKDSKIIVVYRDPIDLYIRANTHQATNGYFPCTDVGQFILYYKTLMEKTSIDSSILCIQYEDLIYNYYPTTERIMDFLGYLRRPENEFKFFNPDVSVKYTNTRPGYNDIKVISRIEQELADYIYDFKTYIPIKEQKMKYEGAKQ